MNEEIGELADRLDETSERLADLSIELLQGALADAHGGESGEARARLERSVTRARRATVKASSLLRDALGSANELTDD